MHKIRLATVSRQTQSAVVNRKAQQIRKRLHDKDSQAIIDNHAEEDLRQVLQYYGPMRMLSAGQIKELEARAKKKPAAKNGQH